MLPPDSTTWTWTMPYRVCTACPASVREAGAAVELALDLGAAPEDAAPDPAALELGAAPVLAGAVATGPVTGPIADSGWPAPGWVLKLSSAPTPAMVPRTLSTTRRIIELP
jgi:hypothetical protein